MILTPVISARIKVVQLGRAKSPVPTEAHDVGGLLRIVVIAVEAWQRRGAIGPRGYGLPVEAVVAGDAVLFAEHVVALYAALVHRLYVRTVADDVVVVHIRRSARYGGGRVRREHSTFLKHAQGLN